MSGASEQGGGAGADGEGTGSGSGRGGGGTGGVAVTRPVKIAGDIDDARDYPAPPGGRQVRNGHSVTIAMIVGVDGRASDCRVISPSPDPAADRLTCELAVARFRFRPATDASGHPVPATYGWRQSWFTG
jgi:protein TonB